jgi:DinB family protein
VKTLARAGHLEEIRRRIRLLTPTLEARWGRMSVDQVVCHLADACRMALGEVEVRPWDGGPRTFRRVIALRVPVRWPSGLTTSPEIDPFDGGTRPVAFAADLETLLALVDRLASEASLAGRVHPVFGPMSERDWLRWGYLHLDHHLRQFGV